MVITEVLLHKYVMQLMLNQSKKAFVARFALSSNTLNGFYELLSSVSLVGAE